MAFKHGKGTVVSIDGDSMTAFSNNIEFKRTADSHDVTTFGKNSHVYEGGLLDGTATVTGIYDDGEASPEATISPLIGTVVELVYQPEGVGSGKPTRTVDVLVMGYTETSPVADMITWTAELQMSDDVTNTTQGA